MIRRMMILVFLIPSIVLCQMKVDVLKLKNGDIIKGEIIENKINDYIRIELMGGSILTYKYDKIVEIAIEKSKTQTAEKPKKIKKEKRLNCYQDGFRDGQKDYSESGTVVGIAGGLFLGVVGWAIVSISGGNQAIQVPYKRTSSLDDDSNCRIDYLSGYQDGAIKKRKSNLNVGGGLGTLAGLLIYLQIQTSSN